MSIIFLRDFVEGTQMYNEIVMGIKRNRPDIYEKLKDEDFGYDIVVGEFLEEKDYYIN